MKRNYFFIAFLALVLSFVFTSCYVGRPYRYDHDDRRYHDREYRHHRHYDRERDYNYGGDDD